MRRGAPAGGLGILERAEREGAEHRHRAAPGGAAEPAAEQRPGDRADAADLGAAEAADLVLAQEVLGLVGEPAGGLLQAGGVDSGAPERALELAEDRVEPAAAAPQALARCSAAPRVLPALRRRGPAA